MSNETPSAAIPAHLQDMAVDVSCNLPQHDDWYPEDTESIAQALHELTAPLVQALSDAEELLTLLHRDGAHVGGVRVARMDLVLACRAALAPWRTADAS